MMPLLQRFLIQTSNSALRDACLLLMRFNQVRVPVVCLSGICSRLINSILQDRTEKYIQFSTTLHKNFPEEIPTGFTKLILMLETNRKSLKESEPPYR